MQKLQGFLEAPRDRIFALTANDDRIGMDGELPIALRIDEQGFYKMKILVAVMAQRFDTERVGPGFVERGLVPPSGVVVAAVFRQQGDSFAVETAALGETGLGKQSFLVTPTVEESWLPLLVSLTEAMERVLAGSLRVRLQEALDRRLQKAQAALDLANE
ncbi:MAG: hypothetical protein HC918_13945 [Oscillatoriales cyanobacterium SM2_1_8]|nr:hypothetical protein [Oscillatoriales cyanobacterium SM2_1_8]